MAHNWKYIFNNKNKKPQSTKSIKPQSIKPKQSAISALPKQDPEYAYKGNSGPSVKRAKFAKGAGPQRKPLPKVS